MPPNLVKPAQWLWTPALLEPKARSLARGLLVLMPFFELQGSTTYNYIDGGKCTVPSGWVWVSNSRGGGLYKTTAEGLMTIPNVDRRFNAGPYTVLVVGDRGSTASVTQAIVSTGSYSGGNGWAFSTEQYNNTGLVGWTSYPDATDHVSVFPTPTAETVIGFKQDLSNNLTIYLDGVADSIGVTVLPDTFPSTVLGLGAAGDGTNAAQFLYEAVYIWDRALTDAEMAVISDDPFMLIRRDMAIPIIVTAGGTAQIVTIGTAAELTTAQPVAAVKPILNPVATVAEIGTPQTVTPLKPIAAAIGTVSETDTAVAVPSIQASVYPVSSAAETDTSQPVAAVKPITVTITGTTEAGTPQPVAAVKPITTGVGTAAETDAGHPVAAVKPIVVTATYASETDAATAVAALKSNVVPIGVTAEVDTARSVSASKPILVAIAYTAETDTGQTIAIVHGTFAVRWREGSLETQTTGASLTSTHAEGDIA